MNDESRNYHILPERLVRVECIVAEDQGITVDQLRGNSSNVGRREFAGARQLVWAIARERLQYTYTRIARMYQRDHTTIMFGVQKMSGTREYERICAQVEARWPGLLDGDSEWKTRGLGVQKG